MKHNMPEERHSTAKMAMPTLVYLLAVLLVFLSFSVLTMEHAVTVVPVEPGVTDLRAFDFANQTAKVAVDWDGVTIYPGVFYTSADFADPNALQKDGQGPPLGDYGTLHMVIRLPSDGVYAIAAESMSFSQRLFVDGVEISAVGRPADTAEGMTPMNRRYTAGFQAKGEYTEIIIHYAGFIHANGGDLNPMLIGTVENVARIEQLRILFEGVLATALLTAALFFFGLFLYFGARRYLLWFSLLCACLALLFLGINNNALLTLLPGVPFTALLRLAYMGTCWAGLFAVLYIHNLFPGAADRRAVGGFLLYCAAVTVFLALAPTPLFTRYPMLLAGSYVAFLVYMLLSALGAALRGHLDAVMTKTEGLLLTVGMALYILSAGINVYAHQHSMKLFGWEYQLVGIMVFLFMNVLALTLVFSRTERALDEARRVQQEMAETNRTLERLNHIRAAFFQNVTHEMKTPLAGIKALAQYRKARLRKADMLDEETERDLDEICQRAGDLDTYTRRLLELSAEQEGRLNFAPVDVAGLLNQAARRTAPVLAERGNRLIVNVPDSLPTLAGAETLLVDVLTNLLDNANRHCRDSVITLTACATADSAEIRIADRGDGIPAGLLPQVLSRGVSGDGGSGLGLAICKENVETHGGKLYIDSRPGQGTQVWFTIPFTHVTQEDNPR